MTDVTETEFIKQKAREEIQDSKIGRVTGVVEHLDESENDLSNFEINAEVDSGIYEERGIPYTAPGSDSIHIPKVGDAVQIEYLDGANSRAIASGTSYSRTDRAPLGRAGMYRDLYESGDSPTGLGDMKITGYTKYDDDPSVAEKSTLSPVESWVQIAKHEPESGPADSDSAPMCIEMYDSPSKQLDDSHIRLSGNQVDGNGDLSMDVEMDFKKGTTTIDTFDSTKPETMEVELDVKDGTLTVGGFGSGKNIKMEVDLRNNTAKLSGDGSNEMGVNLDFDTDEFTLVDGSGYGIESDGSGNFTWHYESINYSQSTTTSL